MTRAGRSHIVFILDRSGSMMPLTEAAVKAYNDLVLEQSQAPGTATITLVLFNTIRDVKCEYVPLSQAPKLDVMSYSPNGGTALLDAVGVSVDQTGDYLSHLVESERPEHVIFTVFTDGHENASNDYTTAQIKAMIEHQESEYNWNFIFLGAQIDAHQVGGSLGVARCNTIQTIATAKGITSAYAQASAMVTSYRASVTNSTK